MVRGARRMLCLPTQRTQAARWPHTIWPVGNADPQIPGLGQARAVPMTLSHCQALL